MHQHIKYCSVSDEWGDGLYSLFKTLVENGDYEYFHPHPLNLAEVERRKKYTGKDLYYVQVLQRCVVGYGMLRGWDEGYDIPSLGIAIHPDFRKRGYGEHFIIFLHKEAKRKRASGVRLKVYASNEDAVRLYKKCGYTFSNQGDSLLGFVSI